MRFYELSTVLTYCKDPSALLVLTMSLLAAQPCKLNGRVSICKDDRTRLVDRTVKNASGYLADTSFDIKSYDICVREPQKSLDFCGSIEYDDSMERNAISRLMQWQKSASRKPLVMQGARQVGKTWLLKEFGAHSYRNVAYINFEANDRMTSLFMANLDIERLLIGLRVEASCPIEPENTLIIFDEVQENPKALAALKYFSELAPAYHVAAAGSLLGIAMHAGTSFPVGKVDFIHLHPLSFDEFLLALGEVESAGILRTGEWPMLDLFRDRYVELLRYYYCVGGMPEAVATFVAGRDMHAVREAQRRLLASYEQDFSKYAEPRVVPRIRAVWDSIPSQLAREQRKFVYGLVREGARAREYELAIAWLCDAGLLHKVHRVSKPGLPLKAYKDANAFKLFMHDTGLLAAHANIPVQALLRGNALFEEFKGALTEQYVSQELRLLEDMDVCYWSSESSQAELDFVFQYGTGVYPLEVKAAENLQAKSLRVYNEKYRPPRCFRASLSAYRKETWLTNLPLYALSRLPGET